MVLSVNIAAQILALDLFEHFLDVIQALQPRLKPSLKLKQRLFAQSRFPLVSLRQELQDFPEMSVVVYRNLAHTRGIPQDTLSCSLVTVTVVVSTLKTAGSGDCARNPAACRIPETTN